MANERSDTMLGHPKGLYVLFFTELWERFSFYSMRGVLTLYMTYVVFKAMGQSAAGGHADQIYGAYLGFVYSAPFIGGMLADRLLGQRRAIYIGGTLMALAQFTLVIHALLTKFNYSVDPLNPMFFLGLALLAAGNGFFKPNISTIVGTLYTQGDARRDAAFTIFYMGINVGALLASFSGQIAQTVGWYWAFLLAGIGMIVGQIIFGLGLGHLPGRGLPPPGVSLTGRGRFWVPNVLVLAVGIVAFVLLAAYLISRPQWVQSLALWVAIPVLAYLLWECARCARGESGAGAADWVVAVLVGVFGLIALAVPAVSSPESVSILTYTLSLPLPSWAWVAPLCIMVIGLVFLVWRGTRSHEGARMIVIIALCCFSMMFWGFYELAGSTITRFTDVRVDRLLFDAEKASYEFGDPVNDGQIGLGASHAHARFDKLVINSNIESPTAENDTAAATPSEGLVAIPYSNDFSDASSLAGFHVVSGTWNVDGGTCEVAGLLDKNSNGVAVVRTALPLPEALEMDVRFEALEADGLDRNGFIIFDYHSPDDFKFVGVHVDAGYWTIGHYNGSWVDDARMNEPPGIAAAHHLHVVLDGGRVTLSVGGVELQASFLSQFPNPLLIVFLSIPFSILWVWLDRRRMEPSSPLKFSLGLGQLALGFLMLYVGAKEAGATGRCNLLWLLLAFFFHTTGELCLSPVGLSTITKLSPARLVGMFMGVWFLASALGNVFAGSVGGMTAERGFGTVFVGIAITTGAAALLLFILVPFLKKLMYGVK